MATEQTEYQRASVVVMKGHGEKRLRQALMQGLVRDEITDDVQEVLEDIDKKQKELDSLRYSLGEANKTIEEHRRIYYDALRAKQREDKRAEKHETAKMLSFVGGTMFLIVLLSMMICRAIFG